MKTTKRNHHGAPAVVLATQTPGTSFEEDMTQRDQVADLFRSCGVSWTIRLHADLDDREIQRIIARYRGSNVTFKLAEFDSTPQERVEFLQRWIAAGGYEISES